MFFKFFFQLLLRFRWEIFWNNEKSDKTCWDKLPMRENKSNKNLLQDLQLTWSQRQNTLNYLFKIKWICVCDWWADKKDVRPRIFSTTRKLLKPISCLQEDRACFSARTAKTKGKGLNSVYRHYVWSKRISKPKVQLERGVNKVEMTEWTSDVRGSGWRRRGSEAGAQKRRTMEQLCFSAFTI